MAAETRVHREFKFNPQTPDDQREVPLTFRLDVWETMQRRNGRNRTWTAAGPADVTRLADGLTRAEMVSLITEGADWLAYLGED